MNTANRFVPPLKQLLLVLLLLGTICGGQEMRPDVAQCPAELVVDDTAGHTISWSTINSNVADVASSPLCLDGERFLIARNCTPFGWQPPSSPPCVYTQQSYADADKCPPGYVSLGADLCVRLTADQPWQNECRLAGTSSTVLDLSAAKRAAVLGHLVERGVNRVWLPARRQPGQPFGPFVWQLPGRNYGDAVAFDEHQLAVEFDESQPATGCLSWNVTANGRSAVLEDCNSALPVLCVYDEASPLLQLACPDGFATTRYEGMQTECFGTQRLRDATDLERLNDGDGRQALATGAGQYNWVESECRGQLFSLDTPEKVGLFERFSRSADLDGDDRCLVGVLPNVLVENRTQWGQLSALVSFVHWALPAAGEWSAERATNVITADRTGRWHWSADISCFACQRSVDAVRRPHVELRVQGDRLLAVVYNREFFWRERQEVGFKCFTDADDELVRSVHVQGPVWSGRFEDDRVQAGAEIRDKTRTVYELRMSGNGPGLYWCDGFALPDFRLVQSERVLAHRRREGDVFAVMVRIACAECRDLMKARYVKQLARRFRERLQQLRRAWKRKHKQQGQQQQQQQLDDDLSIENVRVMRIHAIDMTRNYADILFHVTVNFDADDEPGSGSAEEEDQLQLSAAMIKVYRMRQQLVHILQPTVGNVSAEYRFRGLNSTEFCLPESVSATTNLNWVTARIGEQAAPKELCLLSNGLPVRRHCVGDYIYGGAWLNGMAFAVDQSAAHCNEHKLSPITRSLYEIDRAFSSQSTTSAVIQNVTQLIESADYARLIPADLFYLGRVMQTIIKFNQLNDNGTLAPTNATTTDAPAHNNTAAPTASSALLKRAESENIFTIYNRLMFLNETTTRLSAALNATNVLLEALDNVVNHMSADNLLIRSQVNLTENAAHGTIAMVSAKLLVYVCDPRVANVSGIALVHRPDRPEPRDFHDYEVRLLRSDQSAGELLLDGRLEVAAFVPRTLLARLDETRNMPVAPEAAANNGTNGTSPPLSLPPLPPSPPPPPPPPVTVVITVYYNDLLFQEFRPTTYAKPDGKIISVSIPGYGPILPDLLPIFIRTDRFDAAADPAHLCGYWDFRTNTWSNEGCEFGGRAPAADGQASANATTVMCACSHLTHFAYLIMGTYFHSMADGDDVLVMDTHQGALDLITLLGCSLSLAGIGGICVTALVFPAWREKANSKVLLHLCAAIGLQMILLCFVNTEVRSMHFFVNQLWRGCVAMGALLHYAVLVAFTWMLITAYLQFMRYVRVLGHRRPTRFFLKATLIGWGLPLLPVGLVVIIAPHSYIPDMGDAGQGICYPTGIALYVGVVLPMAVIVLANLVIFVVVIYHVLHGPDGKLRTANERALTLDQLRLSVLLFFLLGLTWIFGFCASTHAGLVFSYLFCLTATLQGFVLFLYFVILDPVTRQLWSGWLKRYLGCSASLDANEMK